jgi:mannose-6-phosphate isomerase-like protein (cupin superfamily)
MKEMQRRSFLQLAVAAIPSSLIGQTSSPTGSSLASTARAVHVVAGADREGQTRAIGISNTAYKVLTKDTGGALFTLEQLNHKKGGPERHLHHRQDEFWYVLEGEYVFEIGSERFHLKAGECILGPREVPHGWAFVGDSTGRLLISFTPAGKMEAFFNQRYPPGSTPRPYSHTDDDAAVARTFGIEVVGPPIALE